MQCKAIFTALVECKKEKIQSIIPEIMIPLVSSEDELGIIRKLVKKVAEEVQSFHKVKINYFVGTMIELPRLHLGLNQYLNMLIFLALEQMILLKLLTVLVEMIQVNF